MEKQSSGTLNVPAPDIHVASKIQSQLSVWLKSENLLLSSVMVEPVTNRQTLLISQCFVSFSFMAIAANTSLIFCIIGLLWFGLSLLSAKKGGVK